MTEEVAVAVEKPLDGLTDDEKNTIITNAVKEIELQDILVCGKCNSVYYILEEFKEHKEGETCKENGEIKEALKDDKKPQIWAFTLWKNTKFKKGDAGTRPPTSWHIYQTWRAMKPPEKQLWMTVATNMQELFEIVSLFEKSKVKYIPKKDEEVKEVKPPVILNKMKASNSRRAIRSGGDPNVELLVEKLVSKRYNPRKKRFEYLVKWEDMDSEENTWEGGASLYNCKQMMEDFEKYFQAQREQNRAQKTLEKQARAHKAAEKMIIDGRPQRTSKQKALNQVKAWCGQESQDQEFGEKRVFSDDSEDDESYEKRIKLEPEDSDSDDQQPVVTIKRVTKNGIERRVGTAQRMDGINLPDNVLIPDAKGIVRISQKQIPSLSSGVYVMSKTAGIIKLDTAAASKLTQGGGQTVLKVAPKIGQASIKVIKKPVDVSNGSKPAVKIITQAGTKTAVKNYSGKVYMQRRTNAQAAAAANKKLPVDEFEKELSKFDDDSDGVEEMAFPDVIQLPTAESPPPEFSLCPLTGKVVDKNGTVIESAEPAMETETLESILTGTDEPQDPVKLEDGTTPAGEITATKTYSASLDNLVNIAAADILNDLKNTEIKPDPDAMESGEEIAAAAIKSVLSPAVATTTTISPQSISSPPPLVPTSSPTVRTIRQTTNSTTSPSILSTALTNANIVRRGPPKLVRRAEPRVGIVQTRTPPHQIVRQVGNAGQSTVVTRIGPTGTTQQVRQIRPGTQVIRKRIVQVPAGTQGQGPRSVVRQQTRVYQQVVKSSPQVTQVTYVATPTNSNKIITMPSLETTPVVSAVTPVLQKEKPVTKVVQQPVVQQVVAPAATQQIVQSPPPAPVATPAASSSDTTTLSLADSDTPLLITGEDGTIYQVAGQNEDGQTILITHGEDGEQQCLLVAPENAGLITQALLKPEQAQEVAAQQQLQQQQQQQQQQAIIQEQQQTQVAAVDQELSINTAVEQAVEEAADDSQVVAQIVSANPPSPGGTRKVVLMLPDGNFMMTEVTAEQYAALELDK